jgi:hypothetical protein
VAAGMRVLAVTFFLAEGCLVPQSVEPIATRPHTIPRVDLATLPDYLLAPFIPLDPQEIADANANPPCQCRLDIHPLVVIADDPTVDVDVRVFVDYDLTVPRSQSPVLTIHLPGTFEPTGTGDPTLRALPDLFLDEATLGGVGTHVVELVLGETAGFAADNVIPPHRAMMGGFESSTFKFVVDVANVTTRQSCSDSPPPPSPAQVKSCP